MSKNLEAPGQRTLGKFGTGCTAVCYVPMISSVCRCGISAPVTNRRVRTRRTYTDVFGLRAFMATAERTRYRTGFLHTAYTKNMVYPVQGTREEATQIV